MDLLNKAIIRLFSDKIGFDEFGNLYYEGRGKSADKKKRFVVYNGIAEPSKVPAEWHSWLHYTTDVAPVEIKTHKSPWQKIHLPNLTGTKYAYFPLGSVFRGGKRGKVGADYEPWKPNG